MSPKKKVGEPAKTETPPPQEPVSEQCSLTDKQRAFVLDYVKHYNATQAALNAGYSEKTAFQIGYENLKKPEIRFYIDRHLEALGITADRVLAEQAALAFSDMGDFVEIHDGGAVTFHPTSKLKGKTKLIKKVKEKRRILSSGEGDGNEVVIESTIELELYDKQKSLEALGKVLGIDKTEQEAEKPNQVQPLQLSYTEWHGLSEDEKTVYLVTGKLPERPEE